MTIDPPLRLLGPHRPTGFMNQKHPAMSQVMDAFG
jgi:hypothetical protein